MITFHTPPLPLPKAMPPQALRTTTGPTAAAAVALTVRMLPPPGPRGGRHRAPRRAALYLRTICSEFDVQC